MSSAYIELAEAVLTIEGRPLSPSQILQIAYHRGDVPWHLRGRTQHKTLHARLSEDIARNLERSPFIRTAPGVFALRSQLPKLSETGQGIYLAPPRRKELKRELFLCLKTPKRAAHRDEPLLMSKGVLNRALGMGEYTYRRWAEIQSHPQLTPVYSFLIVYREAHVLTYRAGKLRPASDPMRGRRTIGFGAPVLASDADLLYDSWYGIVGNAISELTFGLGLPQRLARRARYNAELRPIAGLLAEGEGEHGYLQAIMAYQCPHDFIPAKAALSVNDLRWMPIDARLNNPDDFDATSQFVLTTSLATQVFQ